MLISVLMSVYQNEKPEWLDRALKSVWTDQTLKPNEIILIKDGPLTDLLEMVIERWKVEMGKVLIVLNNEINLGLTKSLNKGLKLATSKYIARMDADDISMPDRFQKQIDYMKEHPEIAVVGGSIQEFNATNDCVNIRHYPETNEEVIKYICKASPCAHPATMIRRAIFDKGIRYNENYRTSQDIALWYDVMCAGYNIGNLNDVVLKFRLTDDIFKRRSRAYAKNEFKIYCNGIYKLYGFFSWRYIYPLFRLIFRLMPVRLIQWLYNSKARLALLQKNVQI